MSRARTKTIGEKYTAVLLADSYTNDFRPITNTLPRALLPLFDSTVIDYSLDCLVSNGFDEIYIFLSSHTKLVEDHIRKCKWIKNQMITIKILKATCSNPGDALRHIHDYDVIRQDFVLVTVDLLTNFKYLKNLVKTHKKRREADASILMTLVFKEKKYSDQPQSSGIGFSPLFEEQVTAVIEPETKNLLFYKPWISQKSYHEMDANDENRVLEIPLQLLKDKPTLEFRSDLIDTNIVICSPELLGYFKENFDFFDIKHDCVRGVLESEIAGSKIAVEVINAPFLCRVNCFNHYAIATDAILNRWLQPISPGLSFSGRIAHNKYTVNSNTYVSTEARVKSSAILRYNVFIGPNSLIEDGADLCNCVIGDNCFIGRNAKIHNSYVWNDVKVGEKCKLDQCLVSNEVVIENGANISPGSILGCKVKIGKEFTTLKDSRIYVTNENDEKAVGKGGEGAFWKAVEEEQKYLDINQEALKQQDDDADSINTDIEELLQDETNDLIPHVNRTVRNEDNEPEAPEEHKFLEELKHTVHRALSHNHDVENCILEINGLKFAYDRSFQDCSNGIVGALLTYCDNGSRNAKEVKELLTKLIEEKWHQAVKKFMASEDIEIEALTTIVETAKTHKVIESIFVHIIKFFYDSDLLNEQSILKWSANLSKSSNEYDQQILKKSEAFLNWLKEAEEEDDESD